MNKSWTCVCVSVVHFENNPKIRSSNTVVGAATSFFMSNWCQAAWQTSRHCRATIFHTYVSSERNLIKNGIIISHLNALQSNKQLHFFDPIKTVWSQRDTRHSLLRHIQSAAHTPILFLWTIGSIKCKSEIVVIKCESITIVRGPEVKGRRTTTAIEQIQFKHFTLNETGHN